MTSHINLEAMSYKVIVSGVATGEWVGPDPPLLFRPLLRFVQIRRKVFDTWGGVAYVHVYCNFLLLTSKEKLFKHPLFFGLVIVKARGAKGLNK